MLNLKKDTAEPLTGISVLQAGVAWNTSSGGKKGVLGKIKRRLGTDLDLAAVALSEGRAVKMCWFDNEDPFENGSLISLGDNTSGRGDGDDETIIARLGDIPASIDAIVFVVSAYKDGVSFSDVEGITLNVYDGGPGGQRLGQYWPDIDARGNACVMAKAARSGDDWTIAIINELGNARSRDQMLQLAKGHA